MISPPPLFSEFNKDLPANYPLIQHLYDIWHFIKVSFVSSSCLVLHDMFQGVLKDLWAAAKLKSCAGKYGINCHNAIQNNAQCIWIFAHIYVQVYCINVSRG